MYDISTLPAYEKREFLRWVAKATEEYFKNPDVQKRFKEWQERMQKKELMKGSESDVLQGM